MNHASRGFTLIELSIVLVIIGLIVGGILVGQDLVRSAQVRAQISQIEKYNTAVNAFHGKYGYLPGDIPNPDATNFGFAARGSYAGEGDGNGVLEGVYANSAGQNSGALMSGEIAMFWVDISAANMIDGTFNSASPSTPLPALVQGAAIGSYLPPAKMGNGSSYVFVFSWQGINYYEIAAVPFLSGWDNVPAQTGLTVFQAYQIDTKMDDGLPMSGNVTTLLSDQNGRYDQGGGVPVTNAVPFATTQEYLAWGPAAWTCMDNRSTANGVMQYSIEQSSGSGVNCTVTFQFQ